LCYFSRTHSFNTLFSTKMTTFFCNSYFFLFDFCFFNNYNFLSFPFVSYDFCFLCVGFFMSFCCAISSSSIVVWWWCCSIPSPWLCRQSILFIFSFHYIVNGFSYKKDFPLFFVLFLFLNVLYWSTKFKETL